MKNLIAIFTVFFLMGTVAKAASINVQRRDMKLASQQMIEKQTISAPALASATLLKTAQATNSAAITTVTSFSAQPDVARNIVVTTGGTTADCNAGNVTITGTNIFGQANTEAIAISENQNGATAGLEAFASVTSVAIPIQDDDGCTYDIGTGDVLGLKRCMDKAGHVVMAVFDGAYETTRPTCVADADEVEKNTCDINGTLNDAKDVELFFIQNFRCLP